MVKVNILDHTFVWECKGKYQGKYLGKTTAISISDAMNGLKIYALWEKCNSVNVIDKHSTFVSHDYHKSPGGGLGLPVDGDVPPRHPFWIRTKN